MEHIGDILKKVTQTGSSRASTGTWYDTEEAEYLPGDPECKICRGSGFVHPLLPNGKPDFSQVVACRCAREKMVDTRRQYMEQYARRGTLQRYSFDNLKAEGRFATPRSREKFAAVLGAVREFADNPRGWLILTGPSGSGKTHLAAAVANHRLNQGQPALFISTPDLLDHLRSAFNPESELTYDDFFQQVRNAPLLVLDDLGAQSSTPWAREKLEQLLNHRYHNEMPTLIASLLAPADFDERMRQRFTDERLSRIFELESPRVSPMEMAAGMDLKLLKSMSFENFDEKRMNLPADQRHTLGQAYQECREFAANPEGWLVLMGNNGCGKTHLACAIANHVIKLGKALQFVVVPDFLDHLRSTFSPDSKVSYDTLFEDVRKTPLLILDDLGAQSATPWAMEKLYQVINYRYNARLPIVITTNCDLDSIDDRISSRLADPKISNLLAITAPDYRSDAVTAKKKVRRRPARET